MPGGVNAELAHFDYAGGLQASLTAAQDSPDPGYQIPRVERFG